MLELHISSVDASNGNVPVSWCISEEIIDKLAEKRAKNPSIVFSLVAQKNSEDYEEKNPEFRKVVRLKDLMTYIELPFAGKNKLFATVVPEPYKEAKEKYLDLKGGCGYYYNGLLNYDKTYYRTPGPFNAEPIDLEVPKEIFAKEPPAWEKKWISWLDAKKSSNQCEYRRKRIFAYTIQPLLFVVYYFFTLAVTLISFMIGMRGFTIKHLVRPLQFTMEEKTMQLFNGGSIFIGKEGYGLQKWKLFPFMPMIMFPILGVIFGGGKVHTIASAILCILVLLALIIFPGLILAARREAKQAAAIPWYLDEEEKDLLVCNGQPKPMSVAELPPKHKTLRIRFAAFKARVCRPFSL